ncbi:MULTISPECIES: serine/threonine protein kinase [Streptosporangium]|uniref:non-specific serine/threonine protein kinase n=1 Tax=Streptosporangium brasiliense TaxID=47480 RepID=A0ABT9QXG5_9ACTN|nr:serine/threonine-protein kinase [Streptosporangium brasiliense]MDP9861688.1 putative Ser/Thr protein kinase [Streptosporangium brasiliense]
MPDLASLRPGDPEQVREYRLTARLGEGGQGTVYLGVAPTGARVAVKLLRADLAQDEEALERFIREVSTAQRVAPFCTAAVIDTGVDQHRPYIVSEYIDGLTLDAVVAQEGPREGSALHRLAIGTVTALVAIHQAGIVHRDFKPSNVLLAPDGPRVIDFGIAKALDRTSTLTAMAIGTPSYMTPEQLAGEAAGSPADMFAWGCTMVFAATGAPPFGTDSLPAIFNRIMNVEPDLRAIADPALRDLVGQCLSKDAALRPTAGEALLRLLGHAGGAPGVPGPTAPRGILAEGSAAAAQQTGPGPNGYQQPQQTGPGGHQQTGPGGYQQTRPAGPGGHPQAHPAGPGHPQQGGPDHQWQRGPGYPQQAPPPPYGGPGRGPAAYPVPGAPPYPGAGPAARRGRGVWVAVGAGLAVTLVAAVGITLTLRGGTTPDPGPSPLADGTRPTAVSGSGDPVATVTPAATPAVSALPQATRTVKLPGSSITLHESDDDPIKLSSYSLDWDKKLYVRTSGTDGFTKNDKYFQYTVNASGTHALATDKVYDKNNYAVVSVVDRRSGSVSKVKITKAPVYPTLPQWSPDGRQGLVTLYEAAGDTSKEYGYAVIDIARKKARIVHVKEKDAGTWSYFWRGDGRAVGTWALTGKTQRIRFYDLQGTVLQTLLDVGTPITVEGDDISPSGTLLMTYCKETKKEICVWSTAADAEAQVRIPFATKRLIGWYDDRHIAGWRRKGTGYEAVVIDFQGKVKRVLATSTNAKEYDKQFMRFTRED